MSNLGDLAQKFREFLDASKQAPIQVASNRFRSAAPQPRKRGGFEELERIELYTQENTSWKVAFALISEKPYFTLLRQFKNKFGEIIPGRKYGYLPLETLEKLLEKQKQLRDYIQSIRSGESKSQEDAKKKFVEFLRDAITRLPDGAGTGALAGLIGDEGAGAGAGGKKHVIPKNAVGGNAAGADKARRGPGKRKASASFESDDDCDADTDDLDADPNYEPGSSASGTSDESGNNSVDLEFDEGDIEVAKS